MPLRWYVVHTLSGHEHKVKSYLEQKIKADSLENVIKDIEIPVENITEMYRGKRRIKEKKVLPGYILVRTNLSDKIWSMINNIPGVMKLLSEGNKPIPLSETDVKRMLGQELPKEHKTKVKMDFYKGGKVRIINGPFTDMTGVVEDIDEDRAKLKVMVTIFGRTAPIELDNYQVEKLG